MPSTGASVEAMSDPEQMSTWQVYKEALLPQAQEVGGEVTERRVETQRSAALRGQVRDTLREKATQETLERHGKVIPEAVQARYNRLRDETIEQATSSAFSEVFVEVESRWQEEGMEVFRPDTAGWEAWDAEQRDEFNQEVMGITNERMLDYVENMFPELNLPETHWYTSSRRRRRVTQREATDPAPPSIQRVDEEKINAMLEDGSITENQAGWIRMAQARDDLLAEHQGSARVALPGTEAITEPSIGPEEAWRASLEEAGGVVRERGMSGLGPVGQPVITETWGHAIMRDMVGIGDYAWNALIDSLDYEVDEEGNVIDPDQVQYRIRQRMDEAVTRVMQSDDPTAADLAIAAALHNPVTFAANAMGTQHYTDPNDPNRRIKTGNFLRDLAINVAQGRYASDAMGELPLVNAFWESHGMGALPEAVGFAAGFTTFTPVAPARLAVRGMAASISASTRVGGRSLGRIASVASPRAGAAIEEAGAFIGRSAEYAADPMKYLSYRRLYRVYRTALEDVTPGMTRTARTMAEEARLPNVAANVLARDMARAAVTGRKVVFSGKPGKAGQVDTVYQELQHAHDRVQRVIKDGHTKSLSGKAVGGAGDPLSQEIATEIHLLLESGWDLANPKFAEEILSNMAAPRLTQWFADVLPNNYMLIGGRMLVPVRQWQTSRKAVNRKARDLLGYDKAAQKSSGLFHYDKPREVLRALEAAMGRTKLATAPFWRTIRTKLASGKGLTGIEQGSVANTAFASIVKGEVSGSVKLGHTGIAFERGTELATGRANMLARTVEDLVRGVGSFAKGYPNPIKPTLPVDNILIRELNNAYHAKLVESPRQLIDLVTSARAKHGDDMFQALNKELGSGSTEADFRRILELFYGGDFHGIVDGPKLARALKEFGISLDVLTQNKLVELTNRLTERFEGLRRIAIGTKADQLDLAVYNFWLERLQAKNAAGLFDDFLAKNPELMLRVGGNDAVDKLIFRRAANDAITGIPDAAKATLISRLEQTIYGKMGTGSPLDPTHYRAMLENIYKNLWLDGALTTGARTRLGEAIEAKVSEVILRAPALRREVTKVITAHLPPGTSKAVIKRSTDVILDEAIGAVFKASTDSTIDRLLGQLSGMGMSIPRSGEKLDAFPMIVRLNGDKAIVMARRSGVQAEVDALQDLMGEAASGKLEQTISSLRRDPLWKTRDWEVLGGILGDGVSWGRRSTIGGLLGGTGAPNLPFLALNVISAPFMIAITAPSYVIPAVKAVLTAPATALAKTAARRFGPGLAQGRFTGRAYNWSRAKFMAGPDDVVMVDVRGKAWTKELIEEVITRNNIRFSQATFEFGDVLAAEVRRGAAMDKNLSKSSWVKQALRWANPANKNFWNLFAENCDMAFRETVFVTALKRGLSEESASLLARNALLDYGAIPARERKLLTKSLLFYAFSRQMFVETAKAITRPGAARNLKNIARLVQETHEQAGTELLEPDYMLSRLWTDQGENWEGRQSMTAGWDIPPMQSLRVWATIIGFGIAVASVGGSSQEEVDMMGRALSRPALSSKLIARAWQDKFLATPWLQAVRDIVMMKGRSEFAPQGSVPYEYIVLLEQFGHLEEAIRFFDLGAREYTASEPGAPPLRGRQFYFKGQTGRAMFITLYFAMTTAGISRGIRDYTKAAIKAGWLPEDAVAKRYGEGDWRWYLAGAGTTIAFNDEAQMFVEYERVILGELRDMMQATGERD